MGIIAAVVAIVLDQFSKYWLLDVVRISERSPIEVVPFFNLVMVWNHGVSFGMLSEPGTDVPYFLIGVALVICGFMGRWLYMSVSKWVSAGIGLVIGGALGNVIDRLRFGAVADFFDLHIASYHWPAFNVADMAIFFGVVMLLWDGFFRHPTDESKSLNS